MKYSINKIKGTKYSVKFDNYSKDKNFIDYLSINNYTYSYVNDGLFTVYLSKSCYDKLISDIDSGVAFTVNPVDVIIDRYLDNQDTDWD